jgi:hypothetical protein
LENLQYLNARTDPISIKKENKKGKRLLGGIVIEKENSLWLNDKETYKYAENDLSGSGWEILF